MTENAPNSVSTHEGPNDHAQSGNRNNQDGAEERNWDIRDQQRPHRGRGGGRGRGGHDRPYNRHRHDEQHTDRYREPLQPYKQREGGGVHQYEDTNEDAGTHGVQEEPQTRSSYRCGGRARFPNAYERDEPHEYRNRQRYDARRENHSGVEGERAGQDDDFPEQEGPRRGGRGGRDRQYRGVEGERERTDQYDNFRHQERAGRGGRDRHYHNGEGERGGQHDDFPEQEGSRRGGQGRHYHSGGGRGGQHDDFHEQEGPRHGGRDRHYHGVEGERTDPQDQHDDFRHQEGPRRGGRGDRHYHVGGDRRQPNFSVEEGHNETLSRQQPPHREEERTTTHEQREGYAPQQLRGTRDEQQRYPPRRDERQEGGRSGRTIQQREWHEAPQFRQQQQQPQHLDPSTVESQQQQPPANRPKERTQRAPRLRRNNFDLDEVDVLFQQRHNQKGISFDNYESIAVEITPKDIAPASSFLEFAVEEALAKNLERCGYERPTPVQKYGIPVCLHGKDLLACAQTGSGKTAAFMVPIVQHILVNGVSPAQRGCALPIALILAPTRELALQIYDDSRKLAYDTDIFCDVAYGGTSYPGHFENDILVACPGRLKDLFDKDRVSFAKVKYLVLDEADRMLELGFDEQIEYLVASRYTDMPPPEERQTLMFSATFPRRIRNLAQNYLRRQYYLLQVGRVGSTTKNITQRIMWVEEDEKQDALMKLLFQQFQTDLVLIFVETRRAAEDLYNLLYEQGIPASTIHGERKQWDREESLKRFKEGKTPILVATDVASRGLDIPDVAHVIQYDLPQAMDDYTHRIGRTGRAGNVGLATAFFNDRNAGLNEELIGYLQEHDQDVPEWMEILKEDAQLKSFSAPKGGRRQGRDSGRGGRPGGKGPSQQATQKPAGSGASSQKFSKPGVRVDDGGF